MAGDADKARLIAEIEAARRDIAARSRTLQEAGAELKQKLNVPQRLGNAYRRQPLLWMGAAAVAGFFFSRITGRKKVVYVDRGAAAVPPPTTKAGAAWGIAKGVLGLAKPFLTTILTERLATMAQRMTQPPGGGAPDFSGGGYEDGYEEADPHS